MYGQKKLGIFFKQNRLSSQLKKYACQKLDKTIIIIHMGLKTLIKSMKYTNPKTLILNIMNWPRFSGGNTCFIYLILTNN